jgi:hypothetical protein
MSDTIVTVYHRNAAGVHEVRLPEIEATRAVGRFPWEWSGTAAGHTDPPEGFVASTGPAGGLAHLRGSSIAFDHSMNR